MEQHVVAPRHAAGTSNVVSYHSASCGVTPRCTPDSDDSIGKGTENPPLRFARSRRSGRRERIVPQAVEIAPPAATSVGRGYSGSGAAGSTSAAQRVLIRSPAGFHGVSAAEVRQPNSAAASKKMFHRKSWFVVSTKIGKFRQPPNPRHPFPDRNSPPHVRTDFRKSEREPSHFKTPPLKTIGSSASAIKTHSTHIQHIDT